jgi:cobalt/nickel transport system permease protein
VHHAVLDDWSHGESWLHRRDPRAKTVAVLAFLIATATADKNFVLVAPPYLVMLIGCAVAAGIPLASLLGRAAAVLPFSLVFAIVSVLAGDPRRALLLAGKSYLSALAVLLLVSTTTLPRLLTGLEMLGVPRFLLMVAQFLYRYLSVLSVEAQHMRVAARSRAGKADFRAAAGAIAVLFARSFTRARDIHSAMLARGFQGHFRLLANLRFVWADAAFLVPAIAVPTALRLVLGGHA